MPVETEAQGVTMQSAKVGVQGPQVVALRRGRDGCSALQALAHQGLRVDARAASGADARDATLRGLGEGGDLPIGEAGRAQAQAPEAQLVLGERQLLLKVIGKLFGETRDVGSPWPAAGALRQSDELPHRRSRRLLHVGERLGSLRALVDESPAAAAAKDACARRRVESAHPAAATEAGTVGIAAPPRKALEFDLVFVAEAAAVGPVVVGEEQLVAGILLARDRVSEARAKHAAALSAPENLTAGLRLPAPLVAELTDLQGAALTGPEPPAAPAAAKTAHKLTSFRPACRRP